MTAISGSQLTQLTRSNKASQQIGLGTIIATLQTDTTVLAALPMKSGSLIVSHAQATASSVHLYTGVASIVGYVIQISSSSGSYSGSSTPYVSGCSGSCLYISPNAAFRFAPDQRIFWIAY